MGCESLIVPIYRVHTTEVVKRLYSIEADNYEQAQELVEQHADRPLEDTVVDFVVNRVEWVADGEIK